MHRRSRDGLTGTGCIRETIARLGSLHVLESAVASCGAWLPPSGGSRRFRAAALAALGHGPVRPRTLHLVCDRFAHGRQLPGPLASPAAPAPASPAETCSRRCHAHQQPRSARQQPQSRRPPPDITYVERRETRPVRVERYIRQWLHLVDRRSHEKYSAIARRGNKRDIAHIPQRAGNVPCPESSPSRAHSKTGHYQRH